MTPEPSSAKIVPAPTVALAEGKWGRYLTRVLKVVLLLILLLWNLLLLGICSRRCRKTTSADHSGAPLAFLRGEEMYALNESVGFAFNK